MLVAILATLTSADVLCLLPCEVATAVHHETAAGPAADHCGGATPSGSATPAMAAGAESCAGQHAWDGPAADRTVTRASVEPSIAAPRIASADASSALAADGWQKRTVEAPPGKPARTSTPLRI